MRPRGRTDALSTAIVGLAVLGSATIVGRDRIVEQWYLWRLESRDEETRLRAAVALGNMKSVRAVPILVRFVAREESPEWAEFFGESKAARLTPLAFALYRICRADLLRFQGVLASSDAERGNVQVLRAIAAAIQTPDADVEVMSYEQAAKEVEARKLSEWLESPARSRSPR